MLSNIFQFIPANTTILIGTILKSAKPRVTVVFDLEDSLWDVTSKEKTKQLKLQGRNKLKQNIFGYSENIQTSFGIRINNINDVEFYEDLNFLQNVSEAICWDCIFLPKVESRSEIEKYQTIFKENSITYKELIPIVETAQGVDYINDLVSQPPKNNFNKIIFGHYDYNLDKGFWPFVDHNSSFFWEITKQLIQACKKNNYNYINGAFFDIDNLNALYRVVSSIQYLSESTNYGQAAMSFKQAEFLCSIKEINSLNYLELTDDKMISDNEKIILANNIVKRFTEDRLLNKSFSFNKKNNLIIPPHQYLAAINYLKSCTVKN